MKYVEKEKAYRIVLHYGSYVASAKIAEMESIDIVRCGECKHYNMSVPFGAKPDAVVIGCPFHPNDPEWFCADGERKEAEA